MSKTDYPLFDCLTEKKHLQAEAAAMRQALEAVMWASLETGQTYCQWCAVSEGEQHLSDCQGNNALAADVGREMLERLERAERERDEARAALAAIHEFQLETLKMGK